MSRTFNQVIEVLVHEAFHTDDLSIVETKVGYKLVTGAKKLGVKTTVSELVDHRGSANG